MNIHCHDQLQIHKGLEGPQQQQQQQNLTVGLVNWVSVQSYVTHKELYLPPEKNIKWFGRSGVLFFYLTGLGGSKDG